MVINSNKVTKDHKVNMLEGSVLPAMLAFTIPLMLSSVLQLLFNACDVIVVGKYEGDNALGAVGSNASIVSLLTNFFMGLSIGANVLVARYFGAKDDKAVSETVHTAMFLSIISGLILTIIGFFGAKQILTWMHSPDEVIDLATIYLKLYFLGMIPTMIYNFGSAILRAVGDTKRPLFYLTCAGVINVLLNLLFIIVFHMGVAGVAIATVIAQCISATLIIRCMMREESSIRLFPKKLRIHKRKLAKIMRIGLPASFQGIIFSISNVIIQSSVNTFGAAAVSGNSAGQSIEGFVYVSMNAFHQSTISFTSQNVGAGKYDRIDKIAMSGLFSVFITGLVMGNLAYIFGRPLVGIYTDSARVVDYGVGRIRIICCTYALCGMMDVMVGSLRGMGTTILPTIVSLIGACGTRLFWIFTFFRMEQFHSLTSLYLTYPVSWIITTAVHVICFFIVKKRLLESRNRYNQIKQA